VVEYKDEVVVESTMERAVVEVVDRTQPVATVAVFPVFKIANGGVKALLLELV
jgi:hypothetical protein